MTRPTPPPDVATSAAPAADVAPAADAAPAADVAPAVDAAPVPRWQRGYLVACCAIIAACAAYWLPHWAELPVLCYIPLQRRWTWSPPSDTPVITYLGLVLWGAAGGFVGAAVGAGLAAVPRRPLAFTTLRLFGAWAITAFVLTGWYYTWNLWPF
jgi:hypothetical protein